MKRGLVIGKFYPPHNGHHYLIDYAAEHVDELDVLVCDSPQYNIDANIRSNWLRQIHPNVKVHIIPDIERDDDSKAWADHTMRFLGYAPHSVFSSEDYGIKYAKFMNARHHMVDRQRVHVPIAATHIRGDVRKNWDFMHPVVRQNYAFRVCVLGSESTGTTTLAKALAKHYQTYWIPEFGRLFSEISVWANHAWESQDFTFIANYQQQMESYFAGLGNKLIICDTNAFATRLWHERYLGAMSEEVNNIAVHDQVDLYILTNVDIPFEQDGVRDGEHIRHAMHKRFIEELNKNQKPYLLAAGPLSDRLRLAKQNINQLLGKKVTI